MAGGKGTRLDADREKPLVRVGGRLMVDRVVDALRQSGVDAVYAATSPNAPGTREHLSVPSIETPGEGYVADLGSVLDDDRIERPVLTVAADLPLLDAAVVDRVLAAHEAGSLTVAVPLDLKAELGVSADATFEHEGREVAPSGLNVVGDGPDRTLVVDDPRLAVNVNRPSDLAAARERA